MDITHSQIDLEFHCNDANEKRIFVSIIRYIRTFTYRRIYIIGYWKVVVDIGVNQISAVVSDNASNVRKAREIIHDKFPNIENVRCIAHCINLIACDIVKDNFGDRLLRRVNILTTFFKNSYQTNARLV